MLGVGALIFRRGAILLVERGREPLKGYWSLPGGLVEPGELLEDAVRREVQEETGLVVKPRWIHKIFERIIRDRSGDAEYHYVLIDYICKLTGGKLRPGDDVSRAEWVRRGALDNYTITEGTLGVIQQAYARGTRS